MRYYLNKNVYEAGLERIRFVFNEFEDVVCWVSGGKDSTAIFNMTMTVAKELNRLPLKVAFIDQETEWQSTIDMIKKWMYRPDVIPLWFQIPFKSGNYTSKLHQVVIVWDEKDKDKWIREKDPIAITDGKRYGLSFFFDFFENVLNVDYPAVRIGSLAGVRAEESPGRFTGLTSSLCYKDITWGTKHNRNKNHVAFYPLYDWSITDVWKYIFSNKLEYNRIYDLQYQYGITLNNMRVSSVQHLKAIRNIFYMQEVEPDTFNKIMNRVSGVNTAKQLGADDFFIGELPFMFKDWKEYRDFLLEKLIAPSDKPKMKKVIHKHDLEFDEMAPEEMKRVVGVKSYDNIIRGQINAILSNDYACVKLKDISRSYSSKFSRRRLHEREAEELRGKGL